jgi:hypothetical protein
MRSASAVRRQVRGSAAGLLALALAASAPSPSLAAPRTSEPDRVTKKARPGPALSLVIEAPTARGAWTMRITNDGEVPVNVAADARLLRLEVTARSAPKPARCELPADMRPADPTERALVVPPKMSYVETFEPRLYCFGAALQDALASGSVVAATLGERGPEGRPPFVAWPIDGVEPEVSPLRSLSAPAFALPDDPTPALMPAPAPIGGPRLSLEGARAVDAASAGAIEIPVTLRNDGSSDVTLRFRPDTLGFDVTGPGGVAECPWPTPPTAPTAGLFTRLPPGGTTALTVLLGAYCATHVFDASGLLVVRPRVDTRKASGDSVGVRAYQGLVIATKPTVVRLHQGVIQRPLQRPKLAP